MLEGIMLGIFFSAPVFIYIGHWLGVRADKPEVIILKIREL